MSEHDLETQVPNPLNDMPHYGIGYVRFIVTEQNKLIHPYILLGTAGR